MNDYNGGIFRRITNEKFYTYNVDLCHRSELHTVSNLAEVNHVLQVY